MKRKMSDMDETQRLRQALEEIGRTAVMYAQIAESVGHAGYVPRFVELADIAQKALDADG